MEISLHFLRRRQFFRCSSFVGIHVIIWTKKASLERDENRDYVRREARDLKIRGDVLYKFLRLHGIGFPTFTSILTDPTSCNAALFLRPQKNNFIFFIFYDSSNSEQSPTKRRFCAARNWMENETLPIYIAYNIIMIVDSTYIYLQARTCIVYMTKFKNEPDLYVDWLSSRFSRV